MPNPYEELPPTAFWRSAVAQRRPLEIADLWRSKFAVTRQDAILTTGSCFAQQIGRELVAHGYAWHDAEPPPPKLSEADRRRFSYGHLSFRVGNIYTAALLHQWLRWAIGGVEPSGEVWQSGARVYDPFRPAVEPDGFASATEMFATRRWTLAAMHRAILTSDLLIFTMGLTEAWIDTGSASVYPMCPGTTAGVYDSDRHRFHNYSYVEILDDMTAAFDLIRSRNPRMRFLLTVSPVPLTATATADHVLVATTHSKSVLRAVAGQLAKTRADTDYFPSYEIVSSFPFKGMFYRADMRSVSAEGVDVVMRAFFAGLRGDDDATSNPGDKARAPMAADVTTPSADDVACEEVLLGAFQRDRA